MSKPITKLPEGVKMLDNGQMEVTVTFDVTKHGHNFGESRNYNVTQIHEMINDSGVQEAISNGYAKGYYGHSRRNVNTGYLPSEVDTNGNEVEPALRTIALSIDGNMVTHTSRIFNTNNGIRIQQLILNGGIGFSAVWNIKDKKFYGFDAVISPNFSENRVLVDSICHGGICGLDVESILNDEVSSIYGDDASESVKEIALDMLMKQEDVMATVNAINEIRGLSDKLTIADNVISSLESDVLSYKSKLGRANKEITTLKSEYKKREDELSVSLDGLGIDLERGAEPKLKDGGLSKLFRRSSFNEEASLFTDHVNVLVKDKRVQNSKPISYKI